MLILLVDNQITSKIMFEIFHHQFVTKQCLRRNFEKILINSENIETETFFIIIKILNKKSK
jgi:hypothetical protein